MVKQVNRLRRLGMLTSLVVLVQCNIPAAGAADEAVRATGSDSGTSSSGGEPSLEEVVVTAQHRVENLQAVPVSAQVVSAQLQREQNLTNLADVAQTIPSIHVDQTARADELYIRGIGSGVNQSFDQSVGMFVDDIYHGRARMTSTLFLDLDRVEVLKGPQSTFFGNNAIAGAFNIVTAKPGPDFGAWSRALYNENDGGYVVEGAVGGPVTDTFGMRFAGTYQGSRGWLKNVATGEDQPKDHTFGGRMTFAWHPSADWDATLKVEGTKDQDDSGFWLQSNKCPPPPPFVSAGFCSKSLSLGLPTGIDNTLNAESPGQQNSLSTAESVLTVNSEHWGHTLTSVTGFYNYHYGLDFDSDITPLTLFNIEAPERYHQFSQEFRLASPAGGPLEYLAGAYFQTDELHFRQDFSYYFLTPKIDADARFGSLRPYLPLGQDTNYAQNEHSYAIFGSLSWNVTEQLKLSGGLRGSWDLKSYDWNLYYGTATQTYGGIVALPTAVAALPAALSLGTPGTLAGDREDHAVLPSAKIQYQIAPTSMVYFSYAKGFKAGGFNGADNTAMAANLPFSPEHVNAYEIGLKSEWLDRRLLLNAAAFRSDYSNLQVAANIATQAGTFISVVRNAASSRSEGLELDGQWLATRDLRFVADVTYLDSKYVDYKNVTPTALQKFCASDYVQPECGIYPQPVGAFQDLSGRPTQYAPKWGGSLSAIYEVLLPRDLNFVTQVTGLFSSRFYVDPTDDPNIQQAGYARLDARMTLESASGRWAFDVIGKNLTDRTIEVFGSNFPLSLGSTIVQKEQPRNVAFQVRYHW